MWYVGTGAVRHYSFISFHVHSVGAGDPGGWVEGGLDGYEKKIILTSLTLWYDSGTLQLRVVANSGSACFYSDYLDLHLTELSMSRFTERTGNQ